MHASSCDAMLQSMPALVADDQPPTSSASRPLGVWLFDQPACKAFRLWRRRRVGRTKNAAWADDAACCFWDAPHNSLLPLNTPDTRFPHTGAARIAGRKDGPAAVGLRKRQRGRGGCASVRCDACDSTTPGHHPIPSLTHTISNPSTPGPARGGGGSGARLAVQAEARREGRSSSSTSTISAAGRAGAVGVAHGQLGALREPRAQDGAEPPGLHPAHADAAHDERQGPSVRACLRWGHAGVASMAMHDSLTHSVPDLPRPIIRRRPRCWRRCRGPSTRTAGTWT